MTINFIERVCTSGIQAAVRRFFARLNKSLGRPIGWATLMLLVAATSCKQKPVSQIEEHASNEDVARYMKNFAGRGALTDSSSQPTPPAEALKEFHYPDDLSLDLVLSEPRIVQPVHISFDQRGRLWVVQYNQYPYPEGLKITAIDNHTRVQFDKVPPAPPAGAKGADKITFFEDTDGDGTFDEATDAITGLNIATSVALGRGKIWVLNPPYLLAYPDADANGIPDGEPEVHLKGFGIEDTHAVANSLRWGPDGWLYGDQGSTTTANVSSAVSKDVAFSGQAIWRYNPETRVFELFAEGGGNNPFNVEIDSKGRIFSGSNGNGRGPYYKQGAYYVKSWGKHGPLTNPYAFGYLPNMPLEGERLRFTHAIIKYEGGSLPSRYNGMMFALNPLHNFVQLTEFQPFGSSFRNVDIEIVLSTEDKWFRPVAITVGPDGAIYMADWYDSRLSHVDPHDTWDKSSGRVYRLRAREGNHDVAPFDMKRLSREQLIAMLSNTNKWFREAALAEFADRKDATFIPMLMPLLLSGDGQLALEALWAINLSGGFTDDVAQKALSHDDPFVRMWAVRLLGDRRSVSPSVLRQLETLSAREPVAEVRSQLACSARRLPAHDALPIIRNLVRNDGDAADPDIPMLAWWALESKAISDRASVLAMFEDPQFWSHRIVRDVILHRLMQRYTMAGGAANFDACARLLELAPSAKAASTLVAGLQEGLLGRDLVALPPRLLKALEPYQAAFGETPLALGLRRGNQSAVDRALKIVSDNDADIGLRVAYARLMGEVDQPAAIPVLLAVAKDGGGSPALKQAALHSLESYPDDEIGQQIAQAYPTIRGDSYVREAALSLLASRASWAKDFFREVEETKTIHKDDVPYYLARRFKLLKDPAIDEKVNKLWPEVRLLTAVEKSERIEKYSSLLKTQKGDVAKGRTLYLTTCGACHRLFDEGGTLGPELTGYDRSNPQYLLLQIVDPNADIREGYESQRVVTRNGRTIEGRITKQSGGSITLAPAFGGPTTTLSQQKIATMEVEHVSLMPERLLDHLTDAEIRDLFSYLMKQ